MTKDEIEQLRRDARELATGVLDMRVGCLAPEEMRDVAMRIIQVTDPPDALGQMYDVIRQQVE